MQKRILYLPAAVLFAIGTMTMINAQEPEATPPEPIVEAVSGSVCCPCAASSAAYPCVAGGAMPWAARAYPPVTYPYYGYPYYTYPCHHVPVVYHVPVVCRTPLLHRIFRPAAVAPYPYWGGWNYPYAYTPCF